MKSTNEYSILVSEIFPLACSMFVLLYGAIFSAYKKKVGTTLIMLTVLSALMYGASLTWEEQIARESSYTGMSLFELDSCTVPTEKYFIFNISASLAVKCDIHGNFQMNEDVGVEGKMTRWALAFYDIYVENIAFSNLRELCNKVSVEGPDYKFFNCSRRLILPENVPAFVNDARNYLPGNCMLVKPESVPMYNMRYTVANCPMRYMRPYVFSISLLALLILSPLSLFYGKWI